MDPISGSVNTNTPPHSCHARVLHTCTRTSQTDTHSTQAPTYTPQAPAPYAPGVRAHATCTRHIQAHSASHTIRHTLTSSRAHTRGAAHRVGLSGPCRPGWLERGGRAGRAPSEVFYSPPARQGLTAGWGPATEARVHARTPARASSHTYTR